jgi:hypothetical protein
MKLESLNIYRSTYPKPEHWKGTIEYKDDDCKSKIELSLTSEQIEGIFPIVAEKLVEVSKEAAHLLKAEIIQEKEKAEAA